MHLYNAIICILAYMKGKVFLMEIKFRIAQINS
jgi:hypothetical protein